MKAIGYARISKDEEGSISLDYRSDQLNIKVPKGFT